MKLNYLACITVLPLAICSSFFPTFAYACDRAQLLDYDYQVKETLGNGYSTFGRLWLLDNQEKCVNSFKYPACLSISPLDNGVKIDIKIIKDDQTSSIYSQSMTYNSPEVITFNTMSLDIYLKLYISDTIADFKLSGRSCNSGFPNMPRQVTRKELEHMYER